MMTLVRAQAHYAPMTWLRTLAMPLQFTSLVFLALVVVIVVMGLHNIPSNIAVAIILIVIGLSWLNKYAFALLDAAANGRREPPVASVEMLGPFDDSRVYAHPLLLAALAGLAWKVGRPAGPWLFGACLVLLPASIAATAMSGRARDAVNLPAVGSTLRGLGAWYPLTLLGEVAVMACVWALLHGALSAPIAVSLGGLAFLAWYASLGALVFERRFDLDFTPVADPEGKAQRQEAERRRRRQQTLDEFYGAIRARESVRATAVLEGWLSQATPAQRALDIDAFITQAETWPEQKGLATLLRGVIAYGLGNGQPALALRAAEEARQRLPAFALEDAADVEALALAARHSGRRRLAAQVIDDFIAARGDRALTDSLATLRADLPGPARQP